MQNTKKCYIYLKCLQLPLALAFNFWMLNRIGTSIYHYALAIKLIAKKWMISCKSLRYN